jgi:hypothetical protein
MKLQLQSLPASAGFITGRPLLEGDRVPTYLVSEWDAVCTMWDGDAICGPVPTLYADNIEVAKKAILADPLKLTRYISYGEKVIIEQFTNTLQNYSVTRNEMFDLLC